MKDPKDPTTPLLPPSSTTGEDSAAYETLEDIILELWDYCLYLEYEYYRTQDKDTLMQFTFCIGLIQYWEDVYFSLGGRNGIQVCF